MLPLDLGAEICQVSVTLIEETNVAHIIAIRLLSTRTRQRFVYFYTQAINFYNLIFQC